MPRVTKAQTVVLKLLRDSCDAFCSNGTKEAVEKHFNQLPLFKCCLVNRETGALSHLAPYSLLKFVRRGWLRCVESRSQRPQENRFRWRMTTAGKRACWHKNPPDGTLEDDVIEVDECDA